MQCSLNGQNCGDNRQVYATHIYCTSWNLYIPDSVSLTSLARQLKPILFCQVIVLQMMSKDGGVTEKFFSKVCVFASLLNVIATQKCIFFRVDNDPLSEGVQM